MNPLLKDLGLEAVNAGTWASEGGWLDDASAPLIQSVNPASGATIGSVRATTAAQYEQVMASARAVAEVWRRVPAPKRGEAVRLVGDELRRHKSALGSLVTLEMGKIKAEGDGEVQEMIDIADFAVGQSRMLYGLSMHSERASHRMFEQWHPLGVVGVVGALVLTSNSVSVLVLIGAIMLAGIVVNNAIVLVDAVNRRRREGEEIDAALVSAGSERLRPILMTTATTVLALFPMALGLGAGDELRAPLAITVIGGLTVATILTLIVIPCLYRIFAAAPVRGRVEEVG